ncbi:LAQU0S05e00144g1_1 [Lachancea quebecensis]|uniref:LAQU0S05e00144g1_1 n=1 Tax=Lachancea quebecensis TaxID=1654605 RepID=A0A0P1KQ74_9SACH|nr:LAQU0S05e00144g1_1 [Lachancea quebecensis]
MTFRLIMVDPSPSNKGALDFPIEKPELAKQHYARNPTKRRKDLSVVMHTFEKGRVEKIFPSCRGGTTRKKNQKNAVTTKPLEKRKNSEGIQDEEGTNSNCLTFPKPLTFVTSVASDYSLEYANAWQSSLEFDVKKAQRPLFRITKYKGRKDCEKMVSSAELLGTMDPNFCFSYNSLNSSKAKDVKHPSMNFSTAPVFRVLLKDR